MNETPTDPAAASAGDDGFVAWLAALTETSNPPQSDLDAAGSVPLPAVNLDTLLLPPTAFPPATEPSQASPQAAQAGSGPPPQPRDAQTLFAAAPPLTSLPQQQPGTQQQLQYQPPQGQMYAAAQQQLQQHPQQQQPQMYSHLQHERHPAALGGQPAAAVQLFAMAPQPPGSWAPGGVQRQQQQQPPQQLQAMHLQQGRQAPPHGLQPAGSSEGIAASLAAQAAVPSAPSALRTNSSGSGGDAAASPPAAAFGAAQAGAAGCPDAGHPAAGVELDPVVAKALRKQRLLQDKNRRAQARFRERQKSKACEQQEQIAELGRRVAELEVERADLASRNAMLQKLATIRSDSAAAAADTESAEDDAVVMAQLADVVNKLQPADSWRAPVTAADVASVSIEEMTARMKEGVQEVGVLLLHGGDDPASPAGQRLTALMSAYSQLVISYCTKRTRRLRALEMAMFNAQAQQHGRPTPEHWRRVMEAIALSEGQRAALRRARGCLLSVMAQLMAQRREVIQLLVAGMPSATDDINNAIGFDKASQASRQLRANLEAEGRHVTEFLLTVDQTISPLQQARWLVESYPYNPDSLSLCNVLAEDADECEYAAAAADTSAWLTPLDGSSGGAGLLPPGSAFRLLAGGGTPTPMQGVVSAAPTAQSEPPPAA